MLYNFKIYYAHDHPKIMYKAPAAPIMINTINITKHTYFFLDFF